KAPLLGKLGFARKCHTALQKAVELDPASIQARNGLITFYREAPPIAGGGIAKAYEHAAAIRDLDPMAGSAIIAELYLSERKYDEAFNTYEMALAVNPRSYRILYLMGRTAAETGRNLDRGEQALRRCLELPPENENQ